MNRQREIIALLGGAAAWPLAERSSRATACRKAREPCPRIALLTAWARHGAAQPHSRQ